MFMPSRGHLVTIVWLLWLSLGQSLAMSKQSFVIFGGLGGYLGPLRGLRFRVFGSVVSALKIQTYACAAKTRFGANTNSKNRSVPSRIMVRP